jgi:hypothetical protein
MLLVSVQDAETSYAVLLLDSGFLYNLCAASEALVLYVAQLQTYNGLPSGIVTALFSTATFALILWLSHNRPAASFVFFAPASFTPVIALSHKVPVLILALAVRNPLIKKGQTWRISR